MIKLDIISDVGCPWCCLGKAFLDRALEARPDHPFTVEWHPYLLNPEMPAEGMDRRAYIEAKFGGKEGVERANAPLLAHARAAGVPLNLDRIARTPSTLDAHRLIHWAGLEGRQNAAVSALFRALWRDGRDIGDGETLTEIGAEIGLDRALVTRLLASDADAGTIRARADHARARGVTGVPTFILAERHVVQGAQPTETWIGIIDDVSGQIGGAEPGR